MKRRDFISSAGMVSLGILLPFGKLFAKKNEDQAIAVWSKFVDYARWCPSPHNVQPWKLKVISETEAHLYYEPKRVPIVVDGTSAFTIAGMGMFIECMNIAAQAEGFKVIAEHENEPDMIVNSDQIKRFAKLYLMDTTEEPSFDKELIKKRKTSRLHYDGRILSSEIVTALTALANRHGHSFTFSSSTELANYSINLNNESVLIRAEEKAAREEMISWIRCTDNEAAEKKDGWWYRCTGFSGRMLGNFFRHHERFENRFMKKKALRMLNRSMNGTANLAWISGNFSDRNDWIKAGIMLQHLWLEMTKHNVYMHPFGPIITTAASKEKFIQKINYSEDPNRLWFLVRLGYSDEPPRSFRLEVKDILIS